MYWILFISLNCVRSEWVAISPVLNKRNTTFPTVQSTTPPSFEVVMNTPLRSENHFSTTPAYANFNEKTRFENENIYLNSSLESESFEETVNDDEDTEESSNKIFYNGFFPFLKLVQNNLLKLTAHKSKMTVLKNLRDVLLSNLHSQISNLGKPKSKAKREARGYEYEHEHEHEMEFPSNEGALMTIGFLTFAVFLIKLVIKLVQALKYKYSYYGTTTTTTAATLILIKRKKREEDLNEKTAQILSSIESFPSYEDFRARNI